MKNKILRTEREINEFLLHPSTRRVFTSLQTLGDEHNRGIARRLLLLRIFLHPEFFKEHSSFFKIFAHRRPFKEKDTAPRVAAEKLGDEKYTVPARALHAARVKLSFGLNQLTGEHFPDLHVENAELLIHNMKTDLLVINDDLQTVLRWIETNKALKKKK